MKNSKNNYVIIGLALVFLFFSACGKKNDNIDEIILPLEINQNKIQNEISAAQSSSPSHFSKEKNNKVENNKILETAKQLANTTFQPLNEDNNYEEENPEQDPLPNIKIYGQALRADGTAITNLFVKATPRGIYELSENFGHVSAKINADESGYFEISGLIPDNYKLYISADDADTITTNVNLFADRENILEFIFPKIKYRTIKGIVKYELTDEPANGIKVKCESGNFRQTITTTENGCFEIKLPIIKKRGATLEINEPGFANVIWRKPLMRYNNELITFLLRKTGFITGKVTNKSGNPLPGILVCFIPMHEFDPQSKVSAFFGRSYDSGKSAYGVYSDKPSNAKGRYFIPNVAAPEAYVLNHAYGKNYYLPTEERVNGIEIFPGETTTFSFVLFKNPNIKIQVKDENGESILKYILNILTKYENGVIEKDEKVDLSNKNDWYNLNLSIHQKKAVISLKAKTKNGRIIGKNNINIKADENYELVLNAGEAEPDISGFIYNHDMTPYIDGDIWVYYSKAKYSSCHSDHLGYFELYGSDIEKGTKVLLQTRKGCAHFTTDVRIGEEQIKWILPELKLITGRVCIGNSDTLATNFIINVLGNRKYFNSSDGTFLLQVNTQNKKKKFKIYFLVSGYASKSVEVNLQDFDSYELGDIIMLNKPAKVMGRIVDEKDNPVNSKVILENINNYKNSIRATTDNSDGSFEFTDVPPGRYTITASSQSNKVESEIFELHSGEYYILPDLIF